MKKTLVVFVPLENAISDISQQAFLSNSSNEECFIELVSLNYGHNVLQCPVDFDTSVVSTALDFACAGENVCLIAADKDILIMLVYMWNNVTGKIEMKIEDTRKYEELVSSISGSARVL